MTKPQALQVTARGDREIVMTRSFIAPRELVFRAFTEPALLKRWLLGPDGWSLAVCEIDLRVGGAYRYVWRRDSNGTEMGMAGVYREVSPPTRIVSTEKFDQAWYEGEAIGTVELDERDGITTITQTLLYESRNTRDAVLKSPMEEGVGASYDRLEKVLSSMAPV